MYTKIQSTESRNFNPTRQIFTSTHKLITNFIFQKIKSALRNVKFMNLKMDRLTFEVAMSV